MVFSRDSDPARRRDKMRGLGVLVASFVFSLLFSCWAKEEALPDAPRIPDPPSTLEIAGFPNQVNPWEVLDRARGLTPRTLFRGWVAEGIQPDGTLDLSKEGTSLTYSFQSPPGQGPQPVRKGGTLPDRVYCGKQQVRVIAPDGIFAKPDETEVSCPRKGPKELSEPQKCSVAEVLAIAKKRDVKDTDSITLEFYEARRGPAYRVSANGRQRFVLSAKDCKKLLNGDEQRGSAL